MVSHMSCLYTAAVRAGFLCDKATLLRDTLKGTVYYIYIFEVIGNKVPYTLG
jgi:hypothetical protein